jgi:hypothetical protein
MSVMQNEPITEAGMQKIGISSLNCWKSLQWSDKTINHGQKRHGWICAVNRMGLELLRMRPRMAKWAIFWAIGAAALVGCQQKQSSIVASVPQPSFGGPSVAQQSPIVRNVPKSAPIKPAPVAKTPTGVPKDWIPTESPNSWNYIVIHHSASSSGNAAIFDKMHRETNGWDELGYHFVIGNGTNSRDGQIEVGPRWPKQKWGAHAKTEDNRYNLHGIGICLVGNFDVDRPTPEQQRSLAKLVAYLMKTYKVPANQVIGHGDTKPTHCPGKNMSVATIRMLASRLVADAGDEIEMPAPVSSELLIDTDATSATAHGKTLSGLGIN